MLISRSALATLFGYFTASWLTNRLQRLAQATQSWAKGDYEVIVHDVHDDELGQLARQLNWMAEQQQVMMEMREQLATLEERNRLARELHDSVKQQVFATGMQIAAARSVMGSNPTQAGDYLEEAERLAQQTQQELTDMLLQLRPLALAGKGLTRAVREYLDTWSRQTASRPRCRCRGVADCRWKWCRHCIV